MDDVAPGILLEDDSRSIVKGLTSKTDRVLSKTSSSHRKEWILDRMRELAGRLFKQAPGRSSSLVDAAAHRSRRWFEGKAAARTAFV
jgi:hypothetical protein